MTVMVGRTAREYVWQAALYEKASKTQGRQGVWGA